MSAEEVFESRSNVSRRPSRLQKSVIELDSVDILAAEDADGAGIERRDATLLIGEATASVPIELFLIFDRIVKTQRTLETHRIDF